MAILQCLLGMQKTIITNVWKIIIAYPAFVELCWQFEKVSKD
jgi:hypothetical protein